MLSRVATAGVRGALRARLPAASAGARARVPLIQPAFQTFHAGESKNRVCMCMRTCERAGYGMSAVFGLTSRRIRIKTPIEAGCTLKRGLLLGVYH